MKSNKQDMTKQHVRNQLLPARRKRGLSRKQVASILGYDDVSTIARQEQGKYIPPLRMLLGFEILYRTPIAYLYPDLYRELKEQIRAREAELPRPPVQLALPGMGEEGEKQDAE
jgi:transcriptional regulator with XRE-family HTH domain